jgi:indolepyruvate ferredoxin oxidoreductase
VPEGSRALGGIGCHYMVTWMDRSTDTFTQMGGEGATWCGQAPFTETEHMFQNLGDGTYFHSGSLAMRQAIAAKVNITYKILYNDAVAMTGGQPVDGTLTVPQLAHQMRSRRRRRRIIVMSDESRSGRMLPRSSRAGVEIRPSRRTRRGAEAHARNSRCHGADLRPDLRDREAPPPQARQARRSRRSAC